MWRILSQAVLTASIVSAVTLLPVSPASTSTTDLASCPSNSLCGWQGTDFTGTMTTFGAGAGCLNSPFLLQSVANTYSAGGVGVPVSMAVYSGPSCTGTLLATVGRGQSVPSLFGWGASVYTTI
jgi:hypothetical protein